MIKVEVTGFSTREQAEKFICWYENMGEQEFGYYVEEFDPDFNQTTDIEKTYPLHWENDTVKLVLKGAL